MLGPKAVSAGNRIFVLYAAEWNRNWDIYAVECTASGPGTPIRVTTHSGVDSKPAGAFHGERLWVAWETNRGGERHVRFTSIIKGSVQGQEQVSDASTSNYSPTITANRMGHVAVAWHSWRDNNYDIYFRERAPSGQWRFERRITRAPTIDRNPVLTTFDDDFWLVFENARTEGYSIGRTIERRLIAAKVTTDGLLAPRASSGSPLEAGSEAGAAVFDKQGRLWIAYLSAGETNQSAWSVRLTGFNGQIWERPRLLSRRLGMDRAPGIAMDGERVYVAFQTDEFPQSWAENDPALTQQAQSRILLGGTDVVDVPVESGFTAFEPLAEHTTPFQAAQLRRSFGEDTETPGIDYQDTRLNLYYGDLHAHTEISVCGRNVDQSVDEAYQVRRDITRLDFVAITDHGYNINPYLWSYSAKMARANEDPGRLLTFLAEEWTSSFERYSAQQPYGYYGHRNLIHADPFFGKWWDAYNGQSPAELWEELRSMNANCVQIPHQLADTGNVPTDWDYTNEQAQPVAEIFQQRGSYEQLNGPRAARRATETAGYYLHDAWKRGIVVGVIASPDHGGGLGKACVWAPALTRTAILDAIRARHTFGTTAARV
ncbi:MAG: hypothetical protein GY953_28395, partial [bacterium]|nr:hypothetical protein [bacterium]